MLELICVFVDQRASEIWLSQVTTPWLETNLASPPRVVPQRDVFYDEDDVRVCSCATSETLLLRVSEIAAFQCGVCLYPYPGYRLPAELRSAESWAYVYEKVYAIWLGSGTLETWAQGQLARPDSELNREGYRLSRLAAEALGGKVYFDLFVEPEEQGRDEPCPMCHGPTRRNPLWKAWVCDACWLIGY